MEERRSRIEGGAKKEGWIEVVEVSGEGSGGDGAPGGSRWVVKNIHAKAKYYFGGSVTWGPGEGAPEGTAFEKVGSTLDTRLGQNPVRCSLICLQSSIL